MIECGAGLGAVLILRWYWWRINAWSEIVATIAPFIAYSYTHFYTDLKFPEKLLGGWLLGIGLVYSCLFGIGKLIFADWQSAVIYGLVGIICAWGVHRLLKNSV